MNRQRDEEEPAIDVGLLAMSQDNSTITIGGKNNNTNNTKDSGDEYKKGCHEPKKGED